MLAGCVTLGSLPNNLTGGGVGKGHSHIVSGVDFSPDGEFVCTSSYDKSLRIWRASNGEPLAVLGKMHGEKGTQG